LHYGCRKNERLKDFIDDAVKEYAETERSLQKLARKLTVSED